MKRWTIAAALLALAACEAQPATADAPAPPPLPSILDGGTAAVFRDAVTGCQYLVTRQGGLVPRYEAGGSNSAGAILNRIRGCE